MTLFVELLLTEEWAFRPSRSVSVLLAAVYAGLGKISLNRPTFFKLWSSTGFLYANIFLKMNSRSPGERSWLTEAGGGRDAALRALSKRNPPLEEPSLRTLAEIT